MSMTMTQKILAHHAGLSEVRPGQLIRAKLDMVLGNDITSPVAINEFEKAGFDQVFDKSRVVMIMDHFASSAGPLPAASIWRTTTTWEEWGLSTLWCRKRA